MAIPPPSPPQPATIAVLGGGAWGTALAESLTRGGKAALLWARNPETVAAINRGHENTTNLRGLPLSQSLRATGDLHEAVASDVVLLATPAQQTRAIARTLKPHLDGSRPLVICAKGLEQASGLPLSRVVAEELPGEPVAVLSGPGFATDIARGLPTALTLASADAAIEARLRSMLSHPQLRLYGSTDVTGVEIGGAVKNVLAIAAGIVDGRKLGGSAHAALVTRGFAELRRFGDAMGCRPETIMGLSGLGDLILTCGSAQSRNMSLGRALGEGRALKDILVPGRPVTEGVYTAQAVRRIAVERGIEMPIATAVACVLEGTVSVDRAITGLLQRPLKAED